MVKKSINNPQIIYWIYSQTWCEIYRNDKSEYHREDGPAKIYWYNNVQKDCEIYYINGKIHREDGPAIIYYNNDKIIKEEYFINGEKLDKFKIRKLKLRNLNLL